MTEEEKKAIEILKGFKEGKQERDKLEINNRGGFKLGVLYLISIQNAIETILNLIEKLQKENEELKNKVVKRDKELIRLEEYANKNFERKDDVKAKYIPKEKIREKIKELEEYIVEIEEETCGKCITIGEDMTIRYLKELLEEE